MLGILAWLMVPLLVTGAAFLVLGMRSRPERPVEAERGMQELDKFREAMSRPMPPAARPLALGETDLQGRNDASAA